MEKRKLAVDALQVDSFDTGGDLPRSGTVHGFDYQTPACDSHRVCEPTQYPSDAPITCDFDCTWTQYTYCPEWCNPNPTNVDNSPC